MLTKEKITQALGKTAPLYAEDLAFLLTGEQGLDIHYLELIRELETEGTLVYTSKNKIALAENLGYISGIFAFEGGRCVVKSGDKSLSITENSLKNALPTDIVLVRPSKRGDYCEIIKVLKKGESSYIGVLKRNGKLFDFTPNRMRLPYKINVPHSKAGEAQANDKVKVELVSFSHMTGYTAKVIKVYGNVKTVGANYEAILDANDIEIEFSPKVIEEAENKAAEKMDNAALKGRLDLRDKVIFTIDPADAKDMDDAVSIERTETGYLLGVHIADVSHYVTESSALDKNALQRGTSVYFADKVVPMLPEILSNGVCSLNECVDRLTMTVLMNIDENGLMKDFEVKESVIHSVKKCSYTDINAIIAKTADENLLKAYEKVLPYIDVMIELAGKLRKLRFGRGSLDFELNEAKVLLGEDGVPTDIICRERGESEKIIEEFMLSANEATAKFVSWQSLPYIYRVHEKPNIEKINTLIRIVKTLGFPTKSIKNGIHPMEMQKIIAHFSGTKYEKVVSMLALRSLAKAKYSENCLGHFGLSLEYYCHFTSPIRRYPDLACHRIIKLILNNKITPQKEGALKNFCEEASFMSSEAEKRALSAERAIEDMYKAWYMSFRIGQSFDGVISSVTGFGFYVELPNTIEGLVRVSDLNDDYYIFNEEKMTLVGERRGRTYNIGDEITVRCMAADIGTGQIDFGI